MSVPFFPLALPGSLCPLARSGCKAIPERHLSLNEYANYLSVPEGMGVARLLPNTYDSCKQSKFSRARACCWGGKLRVRDLRSQFAAAGLGHQSLHVSKLN